MFELSLSFENKTTILLKTKHLRRKRNHSGTDIDSFWWTKGKSGRRSWWSEDSGEIVFEKFKVKPNCYSGDFWRDLVVVELMTYSPIQWNLSSVCPPPPPSMVIKFQLNLSVFMDNRKSYTSMRDLFSNRLQPPRGLDLVSKCGGLKFLNCFSVRLNLKFWWCVVVKVNLFVTM